MSASALYIGSVGHQRHGSRPHRLTYRVFSMLIDLDEIPALDAGLRLFAHNRGGLFSLLDRDHGRGDGRDLKSYVREQLDCSGHSGRRRSCSAALLPAHPGLCVQSAEHILLLQARRQRRRHDVRGVQHPRGTPLLSHPGGRPKTPDTANLPQGVFRIALFAYGL